MIPALVSIHDVMPQTLHATGELVELCESHGIGIVTLLVVPGLPWTPGDLGQLRAWVDRGHELAGHGWVHRCESIRGIRHRLHSRLISRNVAEHLCRDAAGVEALIRQCADWFGSQGIETPQLYVPPAWALGDFPDDAMARGPFGMIETLSGVRFRQFQSAASEAGARSAGGEATGRPLVRCVWLPLAGFEADTWLRQWTLRIVNGFGRRWATHASRCRVARPWRIAIHPEDHRLRLRDELRRTLAMPLTPCSYRCLLPS